MNPFQAYCKANFLKKPNEEKYNFQFLSGDIDRSMFLNVPEERMDEFWAKYNEMKVQAGQQSRLLERPHPEYNLLKIDVDLHHVPTADDLRDSDLKHKYNEEMVMELAALYLQALADIASIPEGAKITIFEKSAPRMKGNDGEKKFIKDGIHIVSGDIVGDNDILHVVYDRFLNMPGLDDIYKKFKNKEPIENMVDRSVISTNAWFPIGSGKVEDRTDYYKPTLTYKIKVKTDEHGLKTIKLKKCELGMDMLQSIIHFSNAHKRPTIQPHDHINVKQLINKRKQAEADNENRPLTIIERTMLQNQIKLQKKREKYGEDYIDHLLQCLDKKRCTDYHQWASIGLCLYNISNTCYPLWMGWSRQVPEKFNEDTCFRKWYIEFPKSSDKYSLGIDVLKQYAYSDNPNKYNEITKTHKSIFLEDMIKNLNRGIGMGNRKWALMAKEYIELHCSWQIKCISTKNNIWYKFLNNQWMEDEGGEMLHKLLMGELYDEIEKINIASAEEITNIEKQIKAFEKNNSRDESRKAVFSPDNDEYGENTLLSRYAESRPMEDVIREKREAITTLKVKLDEAKTMEKYSANSNKYLESSSNRNTLVKDLAHEFYDPDFYKNLDTNRMVFLCKNGVLDLETCNFRKGLPKDISTLNCENAFPTNIDDPVTQMMFSEIEEFLDKLFPDNEMQNYVLNLYAEKLSGVVRREEFFIHTGTGKNGKSKFCNLINYTFGKYFQMTDPTLFSQIRDDPDKPAPTIANIRGKHIIWSSEPKAEKGLQCDTIKRLTGGDPITGRHLNKDPITFQPMCMWNMMCNDIPDMDSTDHGTWRRIRVINYPSKFVPANSELLNDPVKYPNHYVEDNSIEDKLHSWAPYFLFMLFNRYNELKKENFKSLNEAHIPMCVKEATERYKRLANVYEIFSQEHICDNPGYIQNQNDVWVEWTRYIQSANHPTKISQKQFYQHIRRFMGEERRVNREVVYVDRTLKGQGEPMPGVKPPATATPTQ